MKLTTFTDYSLRVLIYVAVRPQRRATIAEIAASFGISQNHLMKVVQMLAHHGWLATTRGKKGGLALAVPAERIRVGEVVRATEGELVPVECFDGHCTIAGTCRLRGVIGEAFRALFAVLDSYTLADLVADDGGLARLIFKERSPVAAQGPH